MKQQPKPRRPSALTGGDSSVAAVRAAHAVLEWRYFDPFPTPSLMRPVAKLLNLLPTSGRLRAMDWVTRSIGHPAGAFRRIDPCESARWVVSGYAGERYRGCIVGAPGLAAVFLAGITKFPFLPQPLLYDARRNTPRDDAAAYLKAGKALAEPLVARHENIEAIIHFDPVHDRFLVGRVIFVRLKYLSLPAPYEEFIRTRLEKGSTVIVLDCGLQWPVGRVSERVWFQLGGLGGIAAEDYLKETPELKRYRERWGAPKTVSWKVALDFSLAPESEWGTSDSFTDSAEAVALDAGHRVIRYPHQHPRELSRAVFRLYEKCLKSDVALNGVYVSTFTHTDPKLPLIAGLLPLWLPFITKDSLAFAKEVLDDWGKRRYAYRKASSALVTLHPSFCNPPDLVALPEWQALLEKHFDKVEFLGINRRKYPEDIASYVSMRPAIEDAAYRFCPHEDLPFREPSAEEIAKVLSQ